MILYDFYLTSQAKDIKQNVLCSFQELNNYVILDSKAEIEYPWIRSANPEPLAHTVQALRQPLLLSSS